MNVRLLFAFLLATPQAEAQRAPDAGVDSRLQNYCDYVQNVGAAQAAPLLLPDLYGQAGYINAGGAVDADGVPLGEPTPRVTAGLSYSLSGVYRGTLIRKRSQVECDRARAAVTLERMAQWGPDLFSPEALDARSAVLAALLPEGEQRVKALREAVNEGQASVDELHALDVRLDALRAQVHATAEERARLQALPPVTPSAAFAARGQLVQAEDHLEQVEASIRTSQAWEVRLRGGYDQLIGADQGVPLFGTVLVTYNLGNWWQRSANERARESRLRWAAEDRAGPHQKVGQLLLSLKTQLAAEEARLAEVQLLWTDVHTQLEGLAALATSAVRRYRDTLWFEQARLSVERAYLQRHVELLRNFLTAQDA